MRTYHLTDFSEIIQKHSLYELTETELLKIGQYGNLSSFYAPFESMNTEAKVVLVGICPGQIQWHNALREAQAGLKQNLPLDTILKRTKSTGAFSGPMRSNLIKILDHIGLHTKLGIYSTQVLFHEDQSIAHMTSLLKHCILVNGKNYAGSSPNMLNNVFLKQHIDAYFLPEISQMNSNVVYIPLGKSVSEVLYFLSSLGYLKEQQILDGFPHPSGANAERIKYFLEEKLASNLSNATNPALIDEAKLKLLHKIEALDFQ